MLVALALVGLVLPAADPVPPSRVFFARAQASAVSADEARLIDSAILTAARSHADRYSALGTDDLQGILNAEAARAALGCDTTNCATELADALNAEELVTTQIGRVGNTWVVTLTRLERSSMVVLAREQIQREGAGADAILPELPRAVDALLAPPPVLSAVGVAGAVTLGVGSLGLAAGGALLGASLLLYDQGLRLHDAGNVAAAADTRALGEPLYYTGYALLGAGAAAAALGGALLWAGLE